MSWRRSRQEGRGSIRPGCLTDVGGRGAARIAGKVVTFPCNSLRNADANAGVLDFCRMIERRADARAAVFLDPFATEVSWETVAALAHTEKVDCLILFPLSAVARTMPVGREPDAKNLPDLDRVFGGREYWHSVYQPSDSYQPKLQAAMSFDDIPRVRQGKSKERTDAVLGLYRDRLSSVFAKVVPTQHVLRNSTNAPMHALFFAASNKKGAPIAVKIAKQIFDNS